MRKKERYEKILAWFRANRPIAETELHYDNPFELLIAVILSAQCTDKRVNMITPALYRDFPTPEALAATTPEVVYEYIRRDDEEQVVGVELAVDHLSFEINKGEFIAVLGHNGSGKSTLAKLINAILVPGEGCIEVDGIDTRKPEMVWEIRQRAGMAVSYTHLRAHET